MVSNTAFFSNHAGTICRLNKSIKKELMITEPDKRIALLKHRTTEMNSSRRVFVNNHVTFFTVHNRRQHPYHVIHAALFPVPDEVTTQLYQQVTCPHKFTFCLHGEEIY